jgi:hypothetical protein
MTFLAVVFSTFAATETLSFDCVQFSQTVSPMREAGSCWAYVGQQC